MDVRLRLQHTHLEFGAGILCLQCLSRAFVITPSNHLMVCSS